MSDPKDKALLALIQTINATGGLTKDENGETTTAATGDWPDLADAYLAACIVLGKQPKINSNRPPDLRKPEPTECVHDLLKDVVHCSYEYPGYINVPLGGLWEMHIGTANPQWGADVSDACQRDMEVTIPWEEEPIDSTSDDFERVAIAIVVMLDRWNSEHPEHECKFVRGCLNAVAAMLERVEEGGQ